MDAAEGALNARLDTSSKADFEAAGETRERSEAIGDQEAAELMTQRMQPALAEAGNRLNAVMEMNRRQAEV